MPTPASGQISMNDVYLETNLTRSLVNFYNSSAVGGLGGLMYHNLAMGSGSQTAANAIWARYNATDDYILSNWYNYSQTPNLVMTFTITNNNANYDVVCDISIYDPNTVTRTNVYTANVPSGSFDTQTDYATTFVVNTGNLGSGVYEIHCNVSCTYLGLPPGPGVINNITTASDSDAVGPGTVRVPNAVPNFDEFNPLTNVPIVQGNISGTGIYANKRTTFTVTFN